MRYAHIMFINIISRGKFKRNISRDGEPLARVHYEARETTFLGTTLREKRKKIIIKVLRSAESRAWNS